MKKLLVFSLISLGICLTDMVTYAQINVEPYLGLTYPVRNIGASEVKEIAGLNAGIEVRKDLCSLPLSVGADLFVASSARQKERADGGAFEQQPENGGYCRHLRLQLSSG